LWRSPTSSLIVLGYIYHCCERDWQPEVFTLVNCIWLTAFNFAAMDFNSMSPMSEFGTLVAMMVIVWGLIILSMLVNVIFNAVVLTSYEGWAIDWLNQYELCEEERQASAEVLALWWNQKQEVKLKGAKQDGGESEAAYLIRLVRSYKKLREVSYLINRNNPDANVDPMTEIMINMKDDLRGLAEKMLGQEDAKIADDEPDPVALPIPEDTSQFIIPEMSVVEQTAAMAARVAQMEEVQSTVLRKIEQLYEQQKGTPPPQ